jgi:Holliday junction resolvasome RuvABC endonuclease subunit
MFFTETKSIADKYEKAVLVPKVSRMDENARMERIVIQDDHITATMKKWCPVAIGYEDYTFGSGKGAGVIQIAELGGVLRLMLWEAGYKIRTHGPTSVKLAWTGHGNAKKKAMIDRAKAYFDKHGCAFRYDFDKLSQLYQEAISDALAVANLVRYEVAFREGKIKLNRMPEHMVRVFNRVTQARPVCLIDRDWMWSGEEKGS